MHKYIPLFMLCNVIFLSHAYTKKNNKQMQQTLVKNALRSEKNSLAKEQISQKKVSPSPTPPQQAAKESQNLENNDILIVNEISDQMLTYTNHWAKPQPSTFTLKINGEDMTTCHEKKMNKCQELDIEYTCEFKKCGILYHQESKKIKYPLTKTTKKASITFSWYTPQRIKVNGIEASSELTAKTITT